MRKLILALLMLLFMLGCSSDKMANPDTPEKLSWLVKQAISNNDLRLLNSYFTTPKQGSISQQQLNELSKLITAAAEYRVYTMVKMDNEILLLDAVKDSETDTYKVQQIIRVPEALKALFEQKK